MTDAPKARGLHGAHGGHLRISLGSVRQLFNSLDPSPFYERDLDEDAERYLVSWAHEIHADEPLKLTLHLAEAPGGRFDATRRLVTDSIHRYFAERARLTRLEFRRLLRQGRASLGIGVAFLLACLGAAEIIATTLHGVFAGLLQESLMIAGWVAMWRPLEIYLYEWWPLRRTERIFRRMSRMPVELRVN